MSYELLQGDCLQTLRTLPDACVQMCVTSPPYYGLRDYQTATWEGGDAECDHAEKEVSWSTPLEREQKKRAGEKLLYRDLCGKCGARRIDNQIGLEETPDAYVAKLVDVFREVRRVLRDDGTLWLNLASSYNGSGGSTTTTNFGKQYDGTSGNFTCQPRNLSNFKPKDMIPIPWMVAMALQQDGYYLRSDIIWAKPNPMPESVTDRPTKSHEYIFLLSKSATYYYDAESIREPHQGESGWARQRANGINTWDYGREGYNAQRIGGMSGRETSDHPAGRNKRSVWSVPTQSYDGAHFATYPIKLIEPCILAGSKRGDTVLDPFNGSGTTGAVALKHGRQYIGCELNPDYIELAHRRIQQSQPMLLEATP